MFISVKLFLCFSKSEQPVLKKENKKGKKIVQLACETLILIAHRGFKDIIYYLDRDFSIIYIGVYYATHDQ